MAHRTPLAIRLNRREFRALSEMLLQEGPLIDLGRSGGVGRITVSSVINRGLVEETDKLCPTHGRIYRISEKGKRAYDVNWSRHNRYS